MWSLSGSQQMPLDYGLQFWGRKRKRVVSVIGKEKSVIIKTIRGIIKIMMSTTTTVMLIQSFWHSWLQVAWTSLV